jgi:riboflavin biosynthesis pyrimidine reductase
VDFRQLLPGPATVEIGELLGSMSLADRAPAQRPYATANFIASVDGRATILGRSGQLGDDGDRMMFHGLREQADAVLAGTNTLRTERYGRMISNAESRARRVERGRSAEPLLCVVTRTGEVPTGIPLFAEPEARIVVFSPSEIDSLSRCAARIELIRLEPSELTPSSVLRRLRSDYGVRLLLCEGGPTLFGALLRERLVDELFLTVAPKLAGGGCGLTISSGPELAHPTPAALEFLLEHSGSLYLRYRLQ